MTEAPTPFGKYVLLKPLGAGAMGDVQLARKSEGAPGHPLVIKRLHRELASHERFVRRFHHEAEIATSVDSVHVARVFEVGEVDGVLYIAMEFIEGWPLSRVFEEVKRSRRLIPLRSVSDIVIGALEGVRALHSARDSSGENIQFVHRDIAPKNLMIGRDGTTRLIDLGLGKSKLQDWKTATGAVMGTPGYMAPEQAKGGKVDARTDLYSLGIVLFEALTLVPYIPIGNVVSMLRSAAAPVFRPPSQHRPEVPSELDRVVEKAVSVEPEDRFQSADEFIAAIARCIPQDEGGRASMDSLIGELLWNELDEKTTEVKRLMAEAPLPPTLIVPRQKKKSTISVPRSVVIGVPVATMIVGLGIGLLYPRSTPAPVAVPPADLPEDVDPTPSVSAREVRAEPPKIDLPTPSRPRPKRKEAIAEPPPPPPEPPPAPAPIELTPLEDLKRQLADLSKRARAVARIAPEGSEQKTRAQQIVIELNAESAHPDAERVRGLSERLRALEQ
jgi:eukaryotic-like serine/threonine-protein kinase